MSRALGRDMQGRMIARPEPGFFQVRAWRGGPHLPARIIRLTPGAHALRHGWTEILAADVFGDGVDVERVWHHGYRVHPDDHEAIGTEYLDAVGADNLYGDL